MTKTVEFCFDVISPAAYIAWHVLPKIAKAARAKMVYTPIFLGGVMQATGNRPPGTVAAKGAWMAQDLPRWAKMYGLEYHRNDVFPQMTLPHMRGAVALQGSDAFLPFVTACFEALHVQNKDVQNPLVMSEILTAIDLDPAAFQVQIGDQAVKDKLKANTEDAVARGVFGAPSFFVGDTMHWGQDRMFMVAEDLGTTIHAALGD